MNYLTQKPINTLAAGLVLAALAMSPLAAAEIPPTTVITPPVSPAATPLQANQIRVNARAPIAFKAIELLDPRTGQPIPPTAAIIVNGKTFTAAAYLVELNKLEKAFNAMGYSLRASEARAALYETAINPVELQNQAQQIGLAHRDIPTPEPLTVRPGATVPFLQPNGVVRTWGYTLGDSNLLSASYMGSLTMSGNKDFTSTNGEARFGGSIFGNSQELLRITGNLRVPRTGTTQVSANVSILGQTIQTPVQDVPLSNDLVFQSGSVPQKPFDFYVAKDLIIAGYIPIHLQVGVKGSAGGKYFFLNDRIPATAPPTNNPDILLWALGQVEPSVKCRAYGQVAVGSTGVADVGLESDLTVLNCDLSLRGEVMLVNRPPDAPGQQPGLNLYQADSCYDTLKILDGKLFISACVSIPFLGNQCVDLFDIWKWPGIVQHGYLFNEQRTVRLQ